MLTRIERIRLETEIGVRKVNRAMSYLNTPAQPISEPVTEERRSKACPQCGSDWIVWLVQARHFDDERDWYRCKQCGHEFTSARPQ